MNPPFDPGLQPERTELAWRRTVLSIAVGSLVSIRLLPAALGHPAWTLCGVIGLLIAGALWESARRRYHAVNRVLARGGEKGGLPGAAMLVLLAVFVVVAGTAGLSVVLVVAFR